MQFLGNNLQWRSDLADDFGAKITISVSEDDKTENLRAEEGLVNEESEEEHDVNEHVDDEDDDSDFSFVSVNPESPIFADDIFKDGQIQPVYPVFDRKLLLSGDDEEKSSAPLRPPLRKLFVEEKDKQAEVMESPTPEGPCCAWSGKVVEASPESCRKSNSTGFSRRWRFKDMVRSHSDGKDAFVFLHPSSANKGDKEKKRSERKEKAPKVKTTPSASEKLYLGNRARKEEEKRRSYLPYKQVGFFANVNELARNIHPF